MCSITPEADKSLAILGNAKRREFTGLADG